MSTSVNCKQNAKPFKTVASLYYELIIINYKLSYNKNASYMSRC